MRCSTSYVVNRHSALRFARQAGDSRPSAANAIALRRSGEGSVFASPSTPTPGRCSPSWRDATESPWPHGSVVSSTPRSSSQPDRMDARRLGDAVPLGKATRCRDVDPFGCTRLTTHSTRSGTPLGRVQSASSGTSAKSPKPRPSRADGGPSLMTPLVEARSIRSTRRASGHRCKRPSQHPATSELSCSSARRTRGPACSSWPIPVPTRRQRPPDKSPGPRAR